MLFFSAVTEMIWSAETACLSPQLGQTTTLFFVRSSAASATTFMRVPHLHRQLETILIGGVFYATQSEQCPAPMSNPLWASDKHRQGNAALSRHLKNAG